MSRFWLGWLVCLVALAACSNRTPLEQREDAAHPGEFRLGRDARALLRAPADDIVLVKIAYWLGR